MVIRRTPGTLNFTLLDLLIDLILILANRVKIKHRGLGCSCGLGQVDRKVWNDKGTRDVVLPKLERLPVHLLVGVNLHYVALSRGFLMIDASPLVIVCQFIVQGKLVLEFLRAARHHLVFRRNQLS